MNTYQDFGPSDVTRYFDSQKLHAGVILLLGSDGTNLSKSSLSLTSQLFSICETRVM